jgi:hypothetical protein
MKKAITTKIVGHDKFNLFKHLSYQILEFFKSIKSLSINAHHCSKLNIKIYEKYKKLASLFINLGESTFLIIIIVTKGIKINEVYDDH